MKKICLVLVAMFAYAEAAYSLVGMQTFVGYRMQKKDDVDHSAYLMKLTGYTNPVVFVPVALGVTYLPYVRYAKNEDNKEDSVTGMELGAEMLGWLPMVPIVTPYAKFNYTFWGNKKTNYEKASGLKDKEDKVSGMEFGIGVSYSFMQFFSVMAEVGYGMRKVEDKDFNAMTFGAGLEASI